MSDVRIGSAEETIGDLAEALEPDKDALQAAARKLVEDLHRLLVAHGFEAKEQSGSMFVVEVFHNVPGGVRGGKIEVSARRVPLDGSMRSGVDLMISLLSVVPSPPAERFLRYSRGLKKLVGDPIVGPNGERFYENAIDVVARDFSEFVTALCKPPST